MKLAFCDGGLCNRLNVLIFGLILRKKYGHEWEMSWPKNTWCGAGFHRLFDLDMNIHEHPITHFKEHEHKYRLLMHENQCNFSPELITFNTGFQDYPDYQAFLDSHQDVFYYNNLIPRFVSIDDIKSGLQDLGINSQAKKVATEFCREHAINETVYGLHIRKTDFGDKVDDKELYRLVSASSARFFVCSDDAKVNDDFSELPNCSVFKKNHFPAKRCESGEWLHWVKDEDGRNFPFNIDRSEESVVEGLIDLLILSTTTLVKASDSTFFNMAGLFKSAAFFRP